MKNTALLALFLASSSHAFTPVAVVSRHTTTSLKNVLGSDIEKDVRRVLNYEAGKADAELAKRFGHLVGAKVKTVGAAFADFTKELGFTVNPLYKNMVTDLVGTMHLTTVDARFQRDAVWCLGTVTALELLLKNYPEVGMSDNIQTALFKSINMDLEEVRAEAATLSTWAQGKTKDEIESALSGEGDSDLAAVSKLAKSDKYWMYSRYFGIGLLKMMEIVGVEMDKDEVYPVMEEWMSNKLGRSSITACSDSDMFFKVKDKLDMMETMMKEIEIREKKRMAERLEDKAELAIKSAEREAEWEKEAEAEKKAKAEQKVDV